MSISVTQIMFFNVFLSLAFFEKKKISQVICCVTFSGVKLSIRSFVLLLGDLSNYFNAMYFYTNKTTNEEKIVK